MTVRTRFAPSPTGYLHIGGARTALFAWLFARQHGGDFILRVEDTDMERSTQAMVDVILNGLGWLGIDYDEGPVYQSERMHRYRQIVQHLLDTGQAYRCYCSQKRLEELREQQMANKQKPRYDGRCRHLERQDPDSPHVIRFFNPDEGVVKFADRIRGTVTVANNELDDLVIMRSDGAPTYNLSVVVDDMDMAITHVIRGDDHVNNTPRQINILQALGVRPPEYAHVPMILGEDGKRLSKRHGAVNVLQYREQGYLPQALLNALVRLGWAYGDQELFTRQQMISCFDIDSVSKSPAAFNLEKLQWMNQHYMKTLPREEVAKALAEQFDMLGIDNSQGPELTTVVDALCERTKTLREMAEWARCYYESITEYDGQAAKKFLRPVIYEPLLTVRQRLAELDSWDSDSLNQVINDVLTEYELKKAKIAQPVRVALTGSSVSPPIDATLQLVGRNRAIERLDQALTFVNMRKQ